MSTKVYPILAIVSPKTTIMANEVVSLSLNSDFSKLSGKTIEWSSTSSGFRVISGNGTANPKIAFSTIGSKTVKVKVRLNGAPSREETVNFNVVVNDIKPPTLTVRPRLYPLPTHVGLITIIASHNNPSAVYEWKHVFPGSIGNTWQDVSSYTTAPNEYTFSNSGTREYGVDVWCRVITGGIYSEWANISVIVPAKHDESLPPGPVEPPYPPYPPIDPWNPYP